MLRGRYERIGGLFLKQLTAWMEGMPPTEDESREPVPSASPARNRNSNFTWMLIHDRERARGAKVWKEVKKNWFWAFFESVYYCVNAI